MYLNNNIVLLEGNTPALAYARHFIQKKGYTIADRTAMDIHYVLLDVPSFHPGGKLRNGKELDALLTALPHDVTICGGNLSCEKLDTYKTIDFLQDERYLAENAFITADCAIRVAFQHLSTTLADAPALVIGWGRIGKCLARMLMALGCDVTVAARKEKDRAMLTALGYRSIDISQIDPEQYRLICNTAPEPVLDAGHNKGCVKIDLASRKGLLGDGVIWARGLPGMYAPETSGKLIAETFLRLTKEVTP